MALGDELLVDFGGCDVVIADKEEKPIPSPSPQKQAGHVRGQRARDKHSRFLFLRQLFGQRQQQHTPAEKKPHHSSSDKECRESIELRNQHDLMKRSSAAEASTSSKMLSTSRRRHTIDKNDKGVTKSLAHLHRLQNNTFTSSIISTDSTYGGESSVTSKRRSQQKPNPYGFY